MSRIFSNTLQNWQFSRSLCGKFEFSADSGHPGNPLLECMADPGSDDVNNHLPWLCWRLAWTLLWTFHHILGASYFTLCSSYVAISCFQISRLSHNFSKFENLYLTLYFWLDFLILPLIISQRQSVFYNAFFGLFRHASIFSTHPCPSVRPSVGHTFGFPFCQRLLLPYVKS